MGLHHPLVVVWQAGRGIDRQSLLAPASWWTATHPLSHISLRQLPSKRCYCISGACCWAWLEGAPLIPPQKEHFSSPACHHHLPYPPLAAASRAVLSLDDDIMMPCADIERAFAVWRTQPEKMVGFYPRLIEGSPLEFRGERYSIERGVYNAVLTGAAFLDTWTAFPAYWEEAVRPARETGVWRGGCCWVGVLL